MYQSATDARIRMREVNSERESFLFSPETAVWHREGEREIAVSGVRDGAEATVVYFVRPERRSDLYAAVALPDEFIELAASRLKEKFLAVSAAVRVVGYHATHGRAAAVSDGVSVEFIGACAQNVKADIVIASVKIHSCILSACGSMGGLAPCVDYTIFYLPLSTFCSMRSYKTVCRASTMPRLWQNAARLPRISPPKDRPSAPARQARISAKV